MSGRRPGAADVAWAGACAGLGAWFVASILSQHPQRIFDRLRRAEPTGVALPDWRFFAPEPARYDFVVLYRTLRADGTETPWQAVAEPKPRTLRHAVWFPERRLDKAVHDLCDHLTQQLNVFGDDGTGAPAYALLSGMVRRKVDESATGDRPRGFQFLIARSSGYDEGEEPRYMYLSRFEKL